MKFMNLEKVNREKDLEQIKAVLQELKKEEKILVAILYGSYARGTPHQRSDIDLAVFIHARDEKEAIEITDKILMSSERQISILRLDDEDESPFVVQEALKGIHLVKADEDTLYEVAHRVLRDAEEIRFRRSLSGK